MMTATLVLYLVLNDEMKTLRVKYPDMATCQAQKAEALKGPPPGTFVLKHAECKVSKAKTKTLL